MIKIVFFLHIAINELDKKQYFDHFLAAHEPQCTIDTDKRKGSRNSHPAIGSYFRWLGKVFIGAHVVGFGARLETLTDAAQEYSQQSEWSNYVLMQQVDS